MADVFISYVEEDSRVAAAIAERLGEDGFSSWRYETDATAGPNYLLQTRSEIEACRVFLVLLSPSSLGSRQVEVEVIRAHECQRPALPVLVDLTYDLFAKRRPDWQQALGGATAIAIPDEDEIAQVVDRITAGVASLAEYRPQIDGPRRRKSWLTRLARRARSPLGIALLASLSLLIVGGAWGWNALREADFRQAMADANSAFNAGRYEEAQSHYDRAVDLRPHDMEARLQRAELHLQLQRYQPALADLAAVLLRDASNADALSLRAQVRYEQEEFDEAIADATAAIRAAADPQAAAYWYRAKTYREQGKRLEAIRDLAEVIAIDPERPLAYHERSELNLEVGNLNDALRDSHDAIARIKGDDALLLEALIQRVQVRMSFLAENFSTDVWNQLVDDLNTIVSIDPDLWPIYAMRGAVYGLYFDEVYKRQYPNQQAHNLRRLAVEDLHRAQKFRARGLDEFRRYFASQPSQGSLLENIDQLIGVIDGLLDRYTAGAGPNADSQALDAYFDAHWLFTANDLRQAFTAASFAVNSQRDFFAALQLRGRIASHLQQDTMAEADFARCLELLPDDAATLGFRGILRYLQGRHEEAVADMTASVEAGTADATIHYYRGLAHTRIGQTEQAIADFSETIHRGPNDPRAYLERGHLLAKQGKFIEAEQDYNTALGRTHDTYQISEAHYWRGVARFFRYDASDEPLWLPAVDDMDQAIQQGTTRPQPRFWRGLGSAVACLQKVRRGEQQPADDALRQRTQEDLAWAADHGELSDEMRSTAKALLAELKRAAGEEGTKALKHRPDPTQPWGAYIKALLKAQDDPEA